MTSHNIREAKINDLSQILALYKELNPKDIPLEKDKAIAIFKEILQSDSFKIFVLEFDSKIVSSCVLNIIPNLTRGGKSYAVIENVVTNSKYRNQGLGSALMIYVIDFALEKNCYKIMLQTGSKNPKTHSFYKKLGFSETEKKAFVIKRVNY